ncbi:flagellar motor switch protein FliG [Brucella endophytica]|uniref:Flagellar motor switch protein FliG n=1 Tax=Brucella endophytica TaxID=1963359 RepID=A0A916SHU0_9HYPH|nr:flagellar motor switch protein FliG [Brucella endophytica]GGA98214.1 flagellar motor switch protein FliG [Brucella endophytica]
MYEQETADEADTSEAARALSLSGPQKAAALLVAIGRPAAARLLKHFQQDDLRLLAAHAKKLDPISPSDFEELVQEFEDAFADGASLSEAGLRFEGLLREALPQEEVDALFDDRPKPALVQESVWDQLTRLPIETLQAYLVEQHPQVIAYTISKLPSDIAARLFIALPARLRSAVVQRTLHIRSVTPAVSAMLEDVLRREVTGSTDRGPQQANHGQIANILNQLDKTEIADMLESLSDLNTDDLSRIKAKLFTFDDIARLSQRARLLLFDEVQTEQVATALRGADPELQEMILSSLSTRGRRMVETELSAAQGNITAQNIADARRAIARIAISLAERGLIDIEADGGAG